MPCKNREKANRAHRLYRKKNREKEREYARRYEAKYPEKKRERGRRYRERHREELRLKAMMKRQQDRKERPEETSQKQRQRSIRWRLSHLEQHRELLNLWRSGGHREQVLQKTDSRCERCGMTDEDSVKRWGEHLSVHHKDRNGLSSHTPNHALDNLQLLCKSCHRKVHHEMVRAVPA